MSYENPNIKDALELAYIQGQKDFSNGLKGETDKINEAVNCLYEKIVTWSEKDLISGLLVASIIEKFLNSVNPMAEELYKIRVTLENRLG